MVISVLLKDTQVSQLGLEPITLLIRNIIALVRCYNLLSHDTSVCPQPLCDFVSSPSLVCFDFVPTEGDVQIVKTLSEIMNKDLTNSGPVQETDSLNIGLNLVKIVYK